MLQHKSFKVTFWHMGIWLHLWVLRIWHSKYPQWWMKVISFWMRQVSCCNIFFSWEGFFWHLRFWFSSPLSFPPSLLFSPSSSSLLSTEDELQLPALHHPALRCCAARCHCDRHHPFHEPLPGPAHVRWPTPHLHQPGWRQCPGHRGARRRLPHQHLHRPQLSRLQQ